MAEDKVLLQERGLKAGDVLSFHRTNGQMMVADSDGQPISAKPREDWFDLREFLDFHSLESQLVSQRRAFARIFALPWGLRPGRIRKRGGTILIPLEKIPTKTTKRAG